MKQEPEEFKHAYTVGELLAYIKKFNVKDDAKIFMQRVEDRYYEGCDISGFVGELPDGSYGKLPKGSRAIGWPVVEKETDMGPTEYTPLESPVLYKEDGNLYLDAHY